MCVDRHFTFVGEIHTQHGGILQAQLGGKLRLFCSGGLCIVQSVSSFNLCAMVLFSLTDQKRKKISQHDENQRLSTEQISPLSCSIQIKG